MLPLIVHLSSMQGVVYGTRLRHFKLALAAEHSAFHLQFHLAFHFLFPYLISLPSESAFHHLPYAFHLHSSSLAENPSAVHKVYLFSLPAPYPIYHPYEFSHKEWGRDSMRIGSLLENIFHFCFKFFWFVFCFS